GYAMGASWGDYDNDGFVDLFISTKNEGGKLYHNNGIGNFVEIIPPDSLIGDQMIQSASWIDYDNNGLLDLFISTRDGVLISNDNNCNDGDCQFTNINILWGSYQHPSWADLDNDGVGQGAVWDIRSNKLIELEDPTNNTCSLGGQQGVSSHSIWDMDDLGHKVVGNSRKPNAGGDECAVGEGASSYGVPTVWNTKTGKATLLTDGIEFIPSSYGTVQALINGERTEAWVRADRVSGNGRTVTGSGNNNNSQLAWVDGKLRDTYKEFGALNSSVISVDGELVAFGTQRGFGRSAFGEGVKVWNTVTDEVTLLGGLRWCEDVPYFYFNNNLCASPFNQTHEDIVQTAGLPLNMVLDANDDLSVITGRVLINGMPAGATIYIDGLGWMTGEEFFTKQGVVEATNLMTNGIFGVSSDGSEMMAGVVGLPTPLTIEVDANKAFVCDKGQDRELSFPKQVVKAVKAGAKFGRCAHLDT
ncbi:VCBS repeat-containing protein, partial [uncultured Pseudoalteromonas sp.]|uniref:FG-GAP repeat domain-containing protein n=1 Tax=uncultured Pseudoalteromonas sp. TaxID=114053 RepID=UPI0026081A32